MHRFLSRIPHRATSFLKLGSVLRLKSSYAINYLPKLYIMEHSGDFGHLLSQQEQASTQTVEVELAHSFIQSCIIFHTNLH